jgi:O-antigen/teichoic acid export membrane protein
MKRKDFLKNIITGFGGQLIAIVLGIIVPRIMISSYGSDVNGVISTTAQVFSYLALLEAGIGQSARIALYKPIADRDNEKISMVFLAAESYFRRITLYYGIGVMAISLIVPHLMKSDMPHLTILSVFFLEGMSGVISFYYLQTPTILLNVDGKGYINNYVTLSNKIIGYLAKIILASLGVNIVLVQFAFFIIAVLKVIFYRIYIKKKYSWIVRRETPDISLLKDKNSYLITEIAWTIFSSTDMMVLSFFVSTKLSSVYSIYNLIYGSINLLLSAVGGSILYVLGQIYYKNRNEYEEVHDAMNTVFIGTMTILMSVSYVLAIPFVKLYTRGVADVDYVYYQLPFMFSLVQLLSWSRYVNGNLTGLAGYAKSTSYVSLAEAIINMILSIALVQKYGITGVLFATVIALPIKVIWCIYISDKKVLHRSFSKTIKMTSCNYIFFFSIVLIMKHVNLEIPTYSMFVLYGCTLVIIIGILGVGLNILINKECLYIAKKIF